MRCAVRVFEVDNRVPASKNRKYLLGRQPILNRNEEIVAYELLFRSPGSQIASVEDASQATANVIVSTLTGFGIKNILGERKGFLNLELELLMNDSLDLLPKKQVVIELLETLSITPELIERCRLLKEKGFTLALDDHIYDPAYHELYQVVDIVKVDQIQNRERLAEMVAQFSRYPLQLLAEKVETREEFNLCKELGFHLFQGYYFAKPSILELRRLGYPLSSLADLMRLLDEDAGLVEIEKIFSGNDSLSSSLQTLINSIGIGAYSKAANVHQAVSLLGRQQVKHWVQLALCAG